MINTTFDPAAKPTASEQLVSMFLPLALTLEADHFHVFLQVCAEEGISLQKLGRLTGLGQSEVIRATSVLEQWQADESAPAGLLCNHMEEARSYRRLASLTPQGVALRENLRTAFGETSYKATALDFHRLMQEELLAQIWSADSPDFLQQAA